MIIMDVFLELALILIVAKLFGYPAVCLGFLAALGQLIGGILIGPSILNLVGFDEALKLSERITLPETVTAFAIAIMLIFAYLAEQFQIAGITGAYLAGLLVASTDEAREVDRKFMTIGYSLFIPVFLVSIGIESDVRVLAHAGTFAVIYAILAIVGKIADCGFGAFISKFRPIEALQVGVGMIPHMEVALIMANVALNEGVFDSGTFSIPVTMVLVTTIVTPFLLKWTFSGE
ncbi:cation:proton antiporter [Pyrococcus kukulkanii]|uniref:cation:proton antiporter n=1 Tax=Pyrococcus kukulkanii TaxID=1609559 RepID=UPI003FEF18B2